MKFSIASIAILTVYLGPVNCLDIGRLFKWLKNPFAINEAIATDCSVFNNRRHCKFNTKNIKLDTAAVIELVVNTAGRKIKCNRALSKGKQRWYGSCDGDADDANFVTRSDKKGTEYVFGSIHVGDDICRIGPNINGEEEIFCVPKSQFKQEDYPKEISKHDIPEQRMLADDYLFGYVPTVKQGDSKISLRRNTINDERRELFDDSGSNIDVMVVWTKEAECGNARLAIGCNVNDSTENMMRGLIDLAVAETNTAYELSGIFTKLRLVHAYRDSGYVEGGDFNTYLDHITSKSDGYMDTVHRKRALYGADIVHLLVGNGDSYCGLAWVGDPSIDYMFGVTSYDCATGFYTFGHEIGHNLNMNHDRGQENKCSEGNTYNYGYKDPAAGFRTILSYDCQVGQCDNMPKNGCTRAQRFSNSDPKYTFNGKPIGNARNDNARQLNNVRARVASFFPAMNCQSNIECNDNDASTDDTCNVSNGVCVFTPASNVPIKAPTKVPVKAPTKVPIQPPMKVPLQPPAKVPVKAPTTIIPVQIPVKVPVAVPIPFDCIVQYVLYNTDTKQNFITLVDSTTISNRPCNINLEGKVMCRPILSSSSFTNQSYQGSVRMKLTNTSTGRTVQSKTENQSPYYLWGNIGTKVNSATLSSGTYTIESYLNGSTNDGLIIASTTPSITFTLNANEIIIYKNKFKSVTNDCECLAITLKHYKHINRYDITK